MDTKDVQEKVSDDILISQETTDKRLKEDSESRRKRYGYGTKSHIMDWVFALLSLVVIALIALYLLSFI